MSSCLSIDAQARELESQRPWFEERWGVKYTFPDAEFRHRCTYCHGREHPCPNVIVPTPSAIPFPAVLSLVATPTMEMSALTIIMTLSSRTLHWKKKGM
jgi:hypothetical protein